jgi:GNAT superfamily N-acetyltransferase
LDVSARPAGESDAEQLGALRRTAHEAVAAERAGPLHLWIEHGDHGAPGEPVEAADDPQRLVAVAEIDGTVVGFLEAGLLAIEGGRCLCRVSAIYVDPGAREVGAGEALVNLVSDWAAAHGAVGIDVVALPGAREVKNFFESSGYVARLIVMHRALPGE